MKKASARVPERIEADAARYAFIRRHARRGPAGEWIVTLDASAHPATGAQFEAALDAAILAAPHLPPLPGKG